MTVTSDLARALFTSAITASDPGRAIERQLVYTPHQLSIGSWQHDMTGTKRVIVIGAGKAAARMAKAVENILGERIDHGVVVVKYGHTETLKKIRQLEAGHPVPDQAGLNAVLALEALTENLHTDDLVIVCWSGGASALMPAPHPPLTLADKQAVTSALLASGADISLINTVRKHCSRLKGGQFARRVAPATVLCLVVSDVVGDDLATIGSGPFVADPTTFAEVQAHINALQLTIPDVVRQFIADGVAGKIADTPKDDEPCFNTIHHHIVASNHLALTAIADYLKNDGYDIIMWQQPLIGEARSAGATFAGAAIHALQQRKKIAIIAGGETTVTLGDNPGKGGRNQEFALAAAGMLSASTWRGKPVPITILAAGTDGTDGPTDAAGAIVDGTTKRRGDSLGLDLLDHLTQHNAYPYLSAVQDLLITGATGTNVMDINIALINPH